MSKAGLPNLTFPNMTFGKHETAWDLQRWLFKSGAQTDIRIVSKAIESGQLGSPLRERVQLVSQIHEFLTNSLERGISRRTVERQIKELGSLFRWADGSGQRLSLETLEASYRHWTDSLLSRVRVGKGLSAKTAYNYAKGAGSVIDRVLVRLTPIVATTRLRRPKSSTRVVSAAADKQNLEETFAFGHLLLDIADGLNVAAIWGPLPVRIRVRNGKVIEEWSGLKNPDKLKPPNPKYPHQAKYLALQSALKRTSWEADKTFRTRYPLINLRIQVEMFMLMAQPAVNLAQAHKLRMDQWRYKPSVEGYEVRTYKNRRFGPVAFQIYPEYRQIFERYLEWRKKIFPRDQDGLLFPLIGNKGQPVTRHAETAPEFGMLKDACRQAGIKYLPPSALRNTNVNWLLRRTQDPDLTADEKQHTKRTLLASYEKPSQQKAMVQIKAFWAKHDPAQQAVGPGACAEKTPMPVRDIPDAATKPDCQTPAGCLFCAHQRDVDSLDHVWSLASYRLLKSFELTGTRDSEKTLIHPAEVAIERITDKLNYIKSSSTKRCEWVSEALTRIEEGRYHPAWVGLIDSQ